MKYKGTDGPRAARSAVNRDTKLRSLLVVVGLAGLTGCKYIEPTKIASLDGLAYDANGPAKPKSPELRRFAEIWNQAEKLSTPTSDPTDSHPSGQSGADRNQTNTPDETQTTGQIVANRRLLKAGMSIIYNSCNDFFIREAQMQQGLSFSRDLNTGVTAPLTGALGLSPAAGIATPLVGFISTGITVGIDASAANFLFGADNIDDVRTLTMNALAAHESTVLAVFENNIKRSTQSPEKPGSQNENSSAPPVMPDFDWVKIQLADHQALCSPGKILWLARQAILKGNICAYTTASATGEKMPTNKKAPPTSALPARVGVEATPSCETNQNDAHTGDNTGTQSNPKPR